MLETEYYLYVGRLIPYKRVDLAIKVFNRLKYPLHIVGKGSQEFWLKSISGGNIKFLGEVSDKELTKLYLGARALIMPQEEDFGIVSVEAQSFGVPVIAYAKGGAVDTVVEGVTGVLFNEQNEKSLRGAIATFEKMSFNSKQLIANAQRFSKESFRERFLKLIK